MGDITDEAGLLVVEPLQLRIRVDQSADDFADDGPPGQQSKDRSENREQEVHPIHTFEDRDREKLDRDEIAADEERDNAHQAEGDVKLRHQPWGIFHDFCRHAGGRLRWLCGPGCVRVHALYP